MSTSPVQLTDEQIDKHLDAVLRASGSALKHYTMHKSRVEMRAAMRSAILAAAAPAEPPPQECAGDEARDAPPQTLRRLVADDAWAMTFQTLGQYRSALLKAIDGHRPLNGIPATWFHGEGARSRCGYCGRYSLDPRTFGDRPPVCECGEKHGWSGSFVKPGPDARWSGASPDSQQHAEAPQGTDGGFLG